MDKLSGFDDLTQWLTEQRKPKGPTAAEKRRALNKATHAELDREESLDTTLARMLEELEWTDIALVCLRITNECKCGAVETHTAGIFSKRTHPRKAGHRLVPLKFFPQHNLPKVVETQTTHLDICKECFIEETDEILVDELLARFQGLSNGHTLAQLSLFTELPERRSH